MIHRTSPDAAALPAAGWLPLRDGWEVTALPLVDTSHPGSFPVFARLTYTDALAAAERLGGMLPDVMDIKALDGAGMRLRCYLGTPTAEKTLVHSLRHDSDMAKQLAERGWAGMLPVANCGKHWLRGATTARSRLMGWSRPDGGWWQPPQTAHNRDHHDDGTTTILVRRAECDPYDTDPAPESDAPESGPPPLATSPGDRGAAVFAWQYWLVEHGYSLPHFGADGDHGGETEMATAKWRAATRSGPELPPPMFDSLPMRQAKHFRWGRAKGEPLWIVIHTAELDPRAGAARNLQSYAATMTGRTASWHVAVDSEGVAPCLDSQHVAFAAPGANARGIQVELATRALSADWADDYHQAMLEQAAGYCAQEARRWGIPLAKVGPTEMRLDMPGLCGHVDVTRGVGAGRTTHHDPGAAFPWPAFIAMCHEVT